MASGDIGPRFLSSAAAALKLAFATTPRTPRLVYWEMTRACSLACRHCRAEAVSTPHEWELSHAESKSLLLQIAGFNNPLPHLILTGGDPLQRGDLYELIDEAKRLQLMVSITPSATPNLTPAVLAKLKAHKIESIGLSLDGSTATRHEAIRGVDGCFDRTICAARAASDLGLPVQINTLVSQETTDDLPRIYELLKTFPIMRWSLFFLISVGRGKILQPLTPCQGEECMNWVFDLSQVAPFQIKTTEAPSFRRVALNRMKKAGKASRRDRAELCLSWIWDSRRQRHRICLQPRLHLPIRLLAPHCRQCAQRSSCRYLSAFSAFPRTAFFHSIQRQMWSM